MSMSTASMPSSSPVVSALSMAQNNGNKVVNGKGKGKEKETSILNSRGRSKSRTRKVSFDYHDGHDLEDRVSSDGDVGGGRGRVRAVSTSQSRGRSISKTPAKSKKSSSGGGGGTGGDDRGDGRVMSIAPIRTSTSKGLTPLERARQRVSSGGLNLGD